MCSMLVVLAILLTLVFELPPVVGIEAEVCFVSILRIVLSISLSIELFYRWPFSVIDP